MKKKILLLGIFAALTTAGFAADITPEVQAELNNKADVQFVVDKVNESHNILDTQKADKSEIADLNGKLNNKADVQFVVDKVNESHNILDAQKADKSEVTDLNNKLNGKVDKNTFEQAYNELHMSQSFTDEAIKTHRQEIDALDKDVTELNEKIETNKQEQVNKDATQDAEIEKGNRVDKVQNQQIAGLQSHNLEQDKNIQTNKDNIANLDNKVNGNTEKLNKLEQDFSQYNGRLTNLEEKVDNLDDKMNKGLSLMAAMNAIDFQNVEAGEMAIGAGIGHYGNAQSVALGVSYSPVEDLNLNAKYSVTAGEPESFAVGAGASYKFKIEK